MSYYFLRCDIFHVSDNYMTLNSKQGTDRKQKKMQKAKKLVYINRT